MVEVLPAPGIPRIMALKPVARGEREKVVIECLLGSSEGRLGEVPHLPVVVIVNERLEYC